MQQDRQDISAIRVFALFERRIAKIDTYPLCTSNITVQKDAYGRLGDYEPGDPDSEGYEVFAALEYGRKEADEGMRFAIELCAAGAWLSVESLQTMFVGFDEFADEKDAARQLVQLGVMLANGQLSVLHTSLRGEWCATELLLRDLDGGTPFALFAEAAYPRRAGKSQADDYEVHIFRNAFAIDRVRYGDTFFLVRKKSDGSFFKFGRELPGGELTPLTKAAHDKFYEEVTGELVLPEGKDTIIGMATKSWEYWLTFGVIAGLTTIGLVAAGISPRWYYLLPFMLLPATFIAMLVAMFSNVRKAAAAEYEQVTIAMRIDRLLERMRARWGVDGTLRLQHEDRVTAVKDELERMRRPMVMAFIFAGVSAGVATYLLSQGSIQSDTGSVPFWMVTGAGTVVFAIGAVLLGARKMTPPVYNNVTYAVLSAIAIAAFVIYGDDLLPGTPVAWVLLVTGLMVICWASDEYHSKHLELKSLLAHGGMRKLKSLLKP